MDQTKEVQVVFTVEPDWESGAFVAYWDDPSGGGITTQANSLSELKQAIKEACLSFLSRRGPSKRIAAFRGCWREAFASFAFVKEMY